MLSNFTGTSVFYAIAATAVIFAVLTVTLKNIFYNALSLVVMLLSVAAIYIYLDAEFLALMQILIYVGAIMVLVIFAIMLTAEIYNRKIRRHSERKIGAFLISAVIAASLIFILSRFGARDSAISPDHATLAALGKELLTTYALPFEFISLILLAALIGGTAIARKE